MEPPPRWRDMVDNIRRVRQLYPAPVDTMGCAKANVVKDADERFRILVSLMLSSQTKDPITWAAVERLRKANLCKVETLKEAQEKDIEELIYPVGFYRRKAGYLKRVARILEQDFGGDIPDSIKDLCSLPGVGPKMAHLCMNEAWETVTGIGVDTHVHRIAARLGWVPKKGTKTPEDTRKALESWMPRDHWREINLLLVGFGQTICTPLRPKCSDCFNNGICPSSSVRGGGGESGKPTASAATAAAVKVKVEPCDMAIKVEWPPEEAAAVGEVAAASSIKREKKEEEEMPGEGDKWRPAVSRRPRKRAKKEK